MTCSIRNCRNNAYNDLEPLKGASIFRFSRGDEEKKEWFDIIDNVKGQFLRKNKKIHFICELHFDESAIKHCTSNTRLKKNAIPTIFPSAEIEQVSSNTTNNPTEINIEDNLETVISSPINISQSIAKCSTKSITNNIPQCSTQSISNNIPKCSTQSISNNIPQSSTQSISQNVPQRIPQIIQLSALQSTPQILQLNPLQSIQTNIPEHSTEIVEQSVIQNMHTITPQSSQHITVQIIPENGPHCRYPGDIDISKACQNPKTAYYALKNYKENLTKERHKVRMLKQYKDRNEIKLKALHDLIENLQTKISVSQNAITHIQDVNNWTTSDLIKELRNALNGPHKDELRAFVTRVLMSFV